MGWQGMDIGPRSLESWKKFLQNAATVFWNGPVGVFEFPHFSQGTNQLAQTLANLSAFTVVGGGDSTAEAINLSELLTSRFSHVSTGGGSFFRIH